jgi:hypothetical protein
VDIATRRQKQQALITELLERKIRLHAQQLYDKRGQTEGFALQDWVEAQNQAESQRSNDSRRNDQLAIPHRRSVTVRSRRLKIQRCYVGTGAFARPCGPGSSGRYARSARTTKPADSYQGMPSGMPLPPRLNPAFRPWGLPAIISSPQPPSPYQPYSLSYPAAQTPQPQSAAIPP